MKLQDRIKLLANRINQPHYIEYHFKKVMQEAHLKGVKDTEEKQLSLCSVSQQRELLSVFDGFYEWHKKKGYVSVKRDDFEEYLKTLNCG